jgi:N-methylhydantoinase A
MAVVVAVDIGGTFTDLVAYDYDTNSVVCTKSPTTYGDFVAGILDCYGKARMTPRDAELVNHGTTLVINSLIQRRGAKTALITTKGFRDVLEIARGNRPDPFNLYYHRDEPLIPRDLRLEVSERINAAGEVITPLDEAELADLARRLKAMEVESVAVFFLNSYANAVHEERALAILKELIPDIFVTVSTSLSREWYEYERTATVAANAFVGPQVTSYISRLEADLRALGFGGSLFMMGSNGGVLSTERASQQSIALVESGPIGGCIGAGVYADTLGFKNVIAFDMGGTTAKCALVEEGRFSVDSVYYVGGYTKGFPIKSSVIDIVEVGSGGGSIAWLDSQQRLKVGPQSAGSTPGPACYGRGGEEPTVTDANLVLGRISASNFLGGELALDTAAAERAIAEKVAGPLGYAGKDSLYRMADGIVSIASVVMAGAIRRISVEHGRDPRDFVLFSYGGGGPLHSGALARELSIPTIVIPPEPGNFSAVGMLLADARLDDSTTFVGTLGNDLVAEMDRAFADMKQATAKALAAEFGAAEVRFERFAEMRYRGQRHNIKVPLSSQRDADSIRRAFMEDYERRYGHADLKAPAEFQALHLSAFARLKRPEIARLLRAPSGEPTKGRRPVYFVETGLVQAEVFDRYALAPGFTVTGPAIIEEYGSTTVVWPGDRLEIGALREIRITCNGA